LRSDFPARGQRKDDMRPALYFAIPKAFRDSLTSDSSHRRAEGGLQCHGPSRDVAAVYRHRTCSDSKPWRGHKPHCTCPGGSQNSGPTPTQRKQLFELTQHLNTVSSWFLPIIICLRNGHSMNRDRIAGNANRVAPVLLPQIWSHRETGRNAHPIICMPGSCRRTW